MAYIDSSYARGNSLRPIGGLTSGTYAGGIVQVSTTTYSTPNTQAITAASYNNLPFSLAINPRRAANRFLIYVRVCGEIDNGWDTTFCLSRNGTRLQGAPSDGVKNAGIAVPVMSYAANAANNSSTPEVCSFWYQDAPGTTATLTYTPVIRSNVAQTIRINRTWDDTNANTHERMISQITIIELGT